MKMTRNGYPGKADRIALYTAHCEGFWKIGVSQNALYRIQGMNMATPFHVTLGQSFVLDREDALAAERAVCNLLSDFAVKGEWFHCSREQMEQAVASVVAQFQNAEAGPQGHRQAQGIDRRFSRNPDYWRRRAVLAE